MLDWTQHTDLRNFTEIETIVLELQRQFGQTLIDTAIAARAAGPRPRRSVRSLVSRRSPKGWGRGKRKGKLPECNAHIVKFASEDKFAMFVQHVGLDLPPALQQAERYFANLSEFHGSPWWSVGYGVFERRL